MCAAGEASQSNNCPDSTVSASPCLTRTKTEPFTPRITDFPSLTISNIDGNEEDGPGEVFTHVPDGRVGGGHYAPSPSSSSNGKQHSHTPLPSSSLLVTTQNTSFSSTLSAASDAGEALRNKQIPSVLTLSSSSSSSTSFQQPLQTSVLQHTLHSQQHYTSARSPQNYHIQQQQQKHSIPTSSQTSSSYHGARGPVQTLPSSTFTSTQQSAVSSSFAPSSVPSISSAASSTSSSVSSSSSSSIMSLSSSSHRGPPGLSSMSSTSCQFSMVSSSVPSSSSSTGSQPGGPISSTITSAVASTTSGEARTVSGVAPFSGRSSGGGSIVTGLSDRAAAATGASVWEGNNLVPSSLAGLIGEDCSDTSSCDSPLRLETEERLSGSRPTTPKVPPLKIIMPPKQGTGNAGQTSASGGVSSNKGNKLPQAKPALPYVLNPSSNSSTTQGEGDSGEHNQTTEPGDSGVDGGGPGYFASIGGSSRPSSRAGVSSSSKLPDGGLEDIGPTSLDLDDGASRDEGSDSRADNTDGSGGKSEEGKRPTRTLRSHTAMLQQAQAKQESKDKPPDKEKNGKTF